MSDYKETLKLPTQQQRPSITIPPKSSSSADTTLFCGTSPGAMTLLSNFLTDGSDCRSFSDLLAGAMASPGSAVEVAGGCERRDNGGGSGGDVGFSFGFGFKRSRPESLAMPGNVSPVLAVSPGFNLSAVVNSPTFFSSPNPFSLSSQQALAQVTSQTALSQPLMGSQPEYYPSSCAPNPFSSSMSFKSSNLIPSSNASQPERRAQVFPVAVDKPADDGFNWRKYGQKQVKGSEYPRSYYRCTISDCPVKKKVERSFDGHITEIIYKGQHNHAPPQNGKRTREGSCAVADPDSDSQVGSLQWLGRDTDSTQATSIQLHGPSDSEESGENYQQIEGEDNDHDDDEPNAKRRNAGAGTSDIPFTHRTMTEPKIVVQTRSEVDLLDDGYRWRKYGQKVVKGNPNPRSYYKCTTVGCKVRKHVERASTDARAVITTYEGKHSHDVPAARGSNSIHSSNIEAQHTRLHPSMNQMSFGNKDQLPVTLQLKEEQMVV